ncbi:hypothetical protein D7D81_16015 [Halocella sp. SP3-1]|nr:hypothetical protein D7D81_16015 [Halocella sp. SP3-1]
MEGFILNEILDIILGCAEGAFLEVGSFVGAVLLLFGYINYKKSGNFVRAIEKSTKWQPIIGALLGLSPGCGGAIFVMPLFVRGTVSFGTVIATLIATMGDSAFLIISTLPLHYLLVSIISFLVAIITGYIVDYCQLADKLLLNKVRIPLKEREEMHSMVDHSIQEIECSGIENYNCKTIRHLGHEEGDEIDLALHHMAKGHEKQSGFAYKFTHSAYKFYWFFVSIGLVFGIMLLMQINVNDLFISNLGMIVGVGGTLFSILLMLMGKKSIQDDTHEETELKLMSLKETLIHNAEETAFVITWVFVAYLVYELGIFALGGGSYVVGEEILTNFMLSTGLLTIIIGAAIGLIPGCGPQIIFVALYTKGLIPFAALLANTISQDGDALFPLLAIDRKSSLWATVITTIPALFVGIIYYFIEIHL